MANENFIDYIKVCCRSGKGGAGSAHFRREKFVPKGGPDGGDGGRGGHIIVKGNRNLWTLLHLRYTKHVIAEHGKPGGGALKTGANGKDVILEVPLGTVIRDMESGEIDFEITEHDEQRVLVEGGMGGLGNDHFKSATNQTPRYSQPGEDGKEEWKIFELKVLADVGLVGFPNAGKSTLLSVVSAAKPQIADYPFTTLTPNLGMVAYRDGKSFVMADIPGIIEGASEGKGLGLRFLRHIERNAILLFMIPVETHDLKKEYEILEEELRKYNRELLDKERIVAFTKSDMLDDEMLQELNEEVKNDFKNINYTFISSVAGKGINELKDMIWKKLIA